MKNQINVMELLLAVESNKYHNKERFMGLELSFLKELHAHFQEQLNPIYRVWHYQKQGWATGYSSDDITRLENIFASLKKSQKVTSQVIWDLNYLALDTVPTR